MNQVKLRLLRQQTQDFNQQFWLKHNTEFKKGREDFIKHLLQTKYADQKNKKTLTSDEMSGEKILFANM